MGDALKIRITAPPVHHAAVNEALAILFADAGLLR
jgi:uncharacterized protein YggU (UPF0235/DUF167 family)